MLIEKSLSKSKDMIFPTQSKNYQIVYIYSIYVHNVKRS